MLMIPYLPDIWVCPGQCICCWNGSIGPVSVRMLGHIWLAVQSVWPENPRRAPMGHVSVGH